MRCCALTSAWRTGHIYDLDKVDVGRCLFRNRETTTNVEGPAPLWEIWFRDLLDGANGFPLRCRLVFIHQVTSRSSANPITRRAFLTLSGLQMDEIENILFFSQWMCRVIRQKTLLMIINSFLYPYPPTKKIFTCYYLRKCALCIFLICLSKMTLKNKVYDNFFF